MKDHLSRIEAWFEDHKQPDFSQFQNYQETYLKICYEPWLGINRNHLPLEHFSKILDCFCDLYDFWTQRFLEYGQPFDLQLWLYENKPIRNELVCAKVRNSGDLRDNYFRRCEEDRSFPAEFVSDRFDPSQFNWQLFYEADEQFEKIDNLSETDINNLLSNNYRQELIAEQRCFWKPTDYVWIGRKDLHSNALI